VNGVQLNCAVDVAAVPVAASRMVGIVSYFFREAGCLGPQTSGAHQLSRCDYTVHVGEAKSSPEEFSYRRRAVGYLVCKAKIVDSFKARQKPE
jgi:hypothetical protein